jgi:hypothetical protein
MYSFRQGVLLPAAPVFDAFSQILTMLYVHGIDGFEPVASLDDLAYFARQRMEFLRRLSSKKHGIYTNRRSTGTGSLPWRSRPTGTGSTPASSTSCCRRPSMKRRSMRTTPSRPTMDA